MNDNVVPKIDHQVVKVLDDLRVEVDLGDGESLIVVLSSEGIITDCCRNGEVIATSSITYDERFSELEIS